jgi:hypothetical protein
LRDTQLYAADEREALSLITSSYSGRLSSSQRVWLSSIISGSDAEIRLGMATYCLVNDTIFKLTRLGRVFKQTVFFDSVMQLVTEFKAVHLKKDKLSLV